MLSRQPHSSFESAQIKLAVSEFFDGGDVLHSSDTDATQEPHKKKQPMKLLGMHFGNHIDSQAT